MANHVQQVDAWLAQYRDLWEQRLDRLALHLARKRAETDQEETA